MQVGVRDFHREEVKTVSDASVSSVPRSLENFFGENRTTATQGP